MHVQYSKICIFGKTYFPVFLIRVCGNLAQSWCHLCFYVISAAVLFISLTLCKLIKLYMSEYIHMMTNRLTQQLWVCPSPDSPVEPWPVQFHIYTAPHTHQANTLKHTPSEHTSQAAVLRKHSLRCSLRIMSSAWLSHMQRDLNHESCAGYLLSSQVIYLNRF